MNRFLFSGFLIAFVATAASVACQDVTEVQHDEETVYVPEIPDYEDTAMWTIYRNDISDDNVDVFYIPSTWEYDWITTDGKLCHYADPSIPSHRADMKIEIDKVAEYMAEERNFYSPFYRHITLDSWATLNEDTINRRYHDVSFSDIENSFSCFLKNYNRQRPFILAGFSQGGKSVVELLKVMDETTRKRMIAAYVLGYKITPDEVKEYPYITGAANSSDTGVVICYNSVSDVKYIKPIVASPNAISINPVNWMTDSTPAILNDTITVILDPATNALVVDGFDCSDLPNILDILNVGDYHGAEPWLYSECLRLNFRERTEAFRFRNRGK